jgi:spermidine/putrescine-binding protein
MPALITASDLRERFDIDSDIEDPRLEPHIASASGRLQKWVPANVYATSDADVLAILKNAEAHLAMHFAILGFNSPISSKGVFITETSTEGKAVRRYLAPKETAELAQQFLDAAQNMVADYMPTDWTPAAPFETIGGSSDCTIDTSCEAVTRSCNG